MISKDYNFTFSKKIGVLWLMPIFISFYVKDLFFVMTLAILPFVVVKNFKNKLNDSNIKFFLAFLIYSFCQNLLDFNEFTIKYLKLFFEGFLVYFVISTIFDCRDVNRLIKIIVLFSIISTIISLSQYYYGTTTSYIVNEGSMGISTFYRIVPLGFDPNYYFLHLILPLCYSINRLKLSKTSFHKITYFLMLVVFSIATLGTSSKAALMILTFLIFINFFKLNRKSFYLIILIPFFIISLPLLYKLIPYSFIRFENLFENLLSLNFGAASTNRTIVWLESFFIFLENPLFGVGLGQVVSINSLSSFHTTLGLVTTHNSFIHLLAEGGIFGFLLLFIPLIRILKKSYKLKSEILFFTIISVILMLFSIDALYYKVVMVYFALVLLIDKKNIYAKKNI